MKVLGNRILVKKIDPPKPESSLIEVIQFEQEESQFALVLGVGNGPQVDPEVTKGDTVVIKPYSGAPLKVNIKGKDVEAHMLAAEDVLAVVLV